MARKRSQVSGGSSAPGSGTATPGSPTDSGAMDSLLEKLRAAGPQAKDQRERRRRRALKEKHATRLASGQHVPDLPLKDGIEEIVASSPRARARRMRLLRKKPVLQAKLQVKGRMSLIVHCEH